MKTLILFSSKYDTTKNCAMELKNYLQGEVHVFSIKDKVNISPEDYDMIILGSSVYVERINKKIKAFMKNNRELLKNRKYGLFICCMSQGNKIKQQMENNFSKDVLDGAAAVECFGGELKFSRMNFIERIMIKLITKKVPALGAVDGKRDIDKINHNNIKNFSKIMCSSIGK